MRLRILLATLGIAGMLWGALNLVREPGKSDPVGLLLWLGTALVLHDAVLVPIVAGVGFLLCRLLTGPVRRYAQGALVVIALVGAVAAPLIYRRDKTLPGKTLLERDYVGNLALIAALIVAITIAAYVISVIGRSRVRANSTNERPPADQDPVT